MPRDQTAFLLRGAEQPVARAKPVAVVAGTELALQAVCLQGEAQRARQVRPAQESLAEQREPQVSLRGFLPPQATRAHAQRVQMEGLFAEVALLVKAFAPATEP